MEAPGLFGVLLAAVLPFPSPFTAAGGSAGPACLFTGLPLAFVASPAFLAGGSFALLLAFPVSAGGGIAPEAAEDEALPALAGSGRVGLADTGARAVAAGAAALALTPEGRDGEAGVGWCCPPALWGTLSLGAFREAVVAEPRAALPALPPDVAFAVDRPASLAESGIVF